MPSTTACQALFRIGRGALRGSKPKQKMISGGQGKNGRIPYPFLALRKRTNVEIEIFCQLVIRIGWTTCQGAPIVVLGVPPGSRQAITKRKRKMNSSNQLETKTAMLKVSAKEKMSNNNFKVSQICHMICSWRSWVWSSVSPYHLYLFIRPKYP